MASGAPFPFLVEWLNLRGSIILKLLAALLFVGLYVYGRVVLSQAMVGNTLSLRAILAEIGVATVGVTVTLLLCKIHPVFGGLFLLSLAVFHAANMEMVLALQTVIRVEIASYGVEKTFLKGSALHPAFVRYGVTLLGSGALLVALWGNTPVTRGTIPLILLAAGVFLTVLVTPLPMFGRSWANGSLVWRSITRTVLDRTVVSPPLGQVRGAPSGLERDAEEDGAELTPQKNVLLVVLEGIPGVYLEGSQKETGREYPVEMERLSEIAEDSLLFPYAVAPNQQTIRGLYALMTGDYPHLDMSTPKAYRYLELEPTNRPPGLPRVLNAAGYRTVFLEAAHLDYMAKGRIMEAMGFERVLGAGYFDHSYASSGWGPDDRAFYEGALGLLEELEKGGDPWFLTLLNVGSHHPYVLPEGFAGDFQSRKLAAVEYLDRSVGWFYDNAKAQGLLENTLLLFVSDEAHGVAGDPLGEYWPVLMAQGPGIEAGVRRYRVGQIDVPWTILSSLGLADGSGMIRRADIFQGAPERNFYFGPFLSTEPGVVYELFGNGMVREYRAPQPLYASDYDRRLLSKTEGREKLRQMLREEERPTVGLPSVGLSFTPVGDMVEYRIAETTPGNGQERDHEQ